MDRVHPAPPLPARKASASETETGRPSPPERNGTEGGAGARRCLPCPAEAGTGRSRTTAWARRPGNPVAAPRLRARELNTQRERERCRCVPAPAGTERN
jgi:hypothetical protein